MFQTSLFDEPEARAIEVPGVRLVPEWLGERDAVALLAALDARPWRADLRRRVQVYGYGYDDGRAAGALAWVEDFPDFLARLATRVTREGLLERFPENVVVNDYAPGVGIGAHVDRAPFGPTVLVVSLGAPCVLEFADPATSARVPLDLPPRSLLVMGGAARARWTHAIAPRKHDVVDGVRRARGRRVSVTFRTRRRSPSE